MGKRPRFHDGFSGDSNAQSQSVGSSFFVPRKNLGGEQSLPHNSLGVEQPLDATNLIHDKIDKARKALANFWYFCNIPLKVAKSSYYEDMVNALKICGTEFKPPTYDDFQRPLLAECVEDTRLHIEEHKKIWVRKGCTIMFDEWTDRRGRTFINFLVASVEGLVFLKSVDASNKIKNGRTLFTLLEDAVLEVGPQNVVQVITNNAVAYVAAGKLLEERFPTIFWTPYATNCIDLILEDMGKISWIKEAIDNAKKITKFIYNHAWVLNIMREHTEEKEIVQLGVTRFATDFLTLQSLHSKRAGLKTMFLCNEWTETFFSTTKEVLLIKNIIFDEAFWKTLHEIIQVSEPLLNVLHIVDSQGESPMGYLYEAMDKVKKDIAGYYKNIEAKYRPIWELIDRRWSSQLHKPIHAAGYYLNPKYFYDEAFVADEEVLSGLYIYLEKIVQDEQKIGDILRELRMYRNAEGYLFSSDLCISSRTTQNPVIWWESFGAKTPELQQVAIRILSQPCSFSKCEHNWSAFEHIHSKKCNLLVQERLNNLMLVHYNLMFRNKQIDGADHDVDDYGIDPNFDLKGIDPTSEWITELEETKQPARKHDWLSTDYFELIEWEIAQEPTTMEEAKVQV